MARVSSAARGDGQPRFGSPEIRPGLVPSPRRSRSCSPWPTRRSATRTATPTGWPLDCWSKMLRTAHWRQRAVCEELTVPRPREEFKMNAELAYVRMLTAAALSQLGERTSNWRIASIAYYDSDWHTVSEEQTATLLISLKSEEPGDFQAYFLTDILLENATLQTAEQLQGHALEAVPGAALPPCPGHRHPSVPGLVDGVPNWVCMTEGAVYFAQPILPNFDPRSTLEEYARGNLQ